VIAIAAATLKCSLLLDTHGLADGPNDPDSISDSGPGLGGASDVVIRAPPGAVVWPGNGHAYMFVRAEVPWELADEAARSRGGHLVTLTSIEENDFVFSLLAKDFDASFDEAAGPWLGAVRISDADDPVRGWKWVTGEPFTFVAWAAGEPSDPADGGETRAWYYSLDHSYGTWADYFPQGPGTGFVVEYE
jgi:hypothetical protein